VLLDKPMEDPRNGMPLLTRRIKGHGIVHTLPTQAPLGTEQALCHRRPAEISVFPGPHRCRTLAFAESPDADDLQLTIHGR
jgi:hypothetical protein